MTQDALHLVLVQDNPTVGDTSGNADKVLDALNRHQDADLLVFSECFISGYPLNDLVLRPGFLAGVTAAIETIREAVVAAQGPAVLLGAPVPRSELPGNAALLIDPDGSIRTVMKTELPNTDVFDERRTFASGDGGRPGHRRRRRVPGRSPHVDPRRVAALTCPHLSTPCGFGPWSPREAARCWPPSHRP